ncbi:BTB/POZ domain-containing protein 6-like [Paramacrobiotus metropolitanus]|uniref:BTB/POZ domain-containing protein 6-like n=1 Tax=Paramacrobiotus metropolitanus TaxID=2943436 RepID=UPI002445F12D|nr:BTB/POZ domain-containing protein 6-like [Paramacrobiotus metropolitanus]
MSRKSLAMESNPQPRRGAVAGISNRLQGSLRNGEMSDIKFVVGRDHGETRTFSAHKYILSLSSDVFFTMFYGSLPERKKTIDIPDVFPEGFEVMLSYVYSDRADLTLENVWPVLNCADKYDLPLLVELCNQFVVTQIQPDNCLIHLENAVKWHADGIEELCFSVLGAHAEAALKSQHFTSISRETLQKLLQRDTFYVDENTVYTAVESWCVEACKRNNLDDSAASRRAVLGEMLHLIRFPLLTPSQLADGPAMTGLLTERELVELYGYQLAKKKPANLPFPTGRRAFKAEPFRLRRKAFQRREGVFVEQDPTGSFWVPAKVIGVSDSQVLVSMHGLSDEGGFRLVQPGKLVRAGDFLKRDRDLVCHCGTARYVDAVYLSLSYSFGARHCLKARNRIEEVPFKDIFVKRDDARKWVVEQESGDISDAEERDGPAKKRLRE